MNKKKKGIIIGTTTAVALAGIVGTAFIPSVRTWLGDHVFTKSNNLANIGGNKDLSTGNKDDKTDSSITVEEFVKTYKIAVPDSFTGTMKVYPSNNGDLLLICSSAEGVYLYDAEKDKVVCIKSFNLYSGSIINVGNGDYLMSCGRDVAGARGLYLYDSLTKEIKQLTSLGYCYNNFVSLPDDTIILSTENSSASNSDFLIYDKNQKRVSILLSPGHRVGFVYKMQDNRILLCPYRASDSFSIYDYKTGEIKTIEFNSTLTYTANCFAESDNFVFISNTGTKGLLCLNKNTDEITLVSDALCDVWHCYTLDNGNVLLSARFGSAGLYLFNIETLELGQVYASGYDYKYFYKLSNGNLFVVSDSLNAFVILESESMDVLDAYYPNTTGYRRDICSYELPNGNLLLMPISLSSLYVANVKDNTIDRLTLNYSTTSNSMQLVDGDVLFVLEGMGGVALYRYASNSVSVYFTNNTAKEIVDNEDGTYTIKFEDFNDVEYSSIKKQFYMIYSVDTEAEAE